MCQKYTHKVRHVYALKVSGLQLQWKFIFVFIADGRPILNIGCLALISNRHNLVAPKANGSLQLLMSVVQQPKWVDPPRPQVGSAKALFPAVPVANLTNIYDV